MAEEQSIRVNFGKPMPLFPLDHAALLPQQVLPLHVFEQRYRNMTDDVLDSAGQIAMAIFGGDDWPAEYERSPKLMPAVCVGQIVQHESLEDGRYNILLQGVCRARIVEELPIDDERGYRRAVLEPLGLENSNPEDLVETREWLAGLLDTGPLRRLVVAEQVLDYVRNEMIPGEALVELVAFSMLTEPETRYALLAEPDPAARLELVRTGLDDLAETIKLADTQASDSWPKGCSWN